MLVAIAVYWCCRLLLVCRCWCGLLSLVFVVVVVDVVSVVGVAAGAEGCPCSCCLLYAGVAVVAGVHCVL